MPYQLQPGTLPHRVVAWLQAQAKATGDPKAVYSTAVLCDALEADPAGLSSCMSRAKEAGVVKAERLAGRGMTFWWSLGNGAEVVLQQEEEQDEQPRRSAPEVKPHLGAIFPGGVRGDEPVPEPTPAPAPAPAGRPMTLREIADAEEKPAPRTPFDAWFSGVSGELVLQGAHIQPDGDVVLSKHQVRLLLAALSGRAA